MTLKWLPNALTIGRCILAIVVGYTILDFSTRLRAGDGATLMAFLPFALFSFAVTLQWLWAFAGALALDTWWLRVIKLALGFSYIAL